MTYSTPSPRSNATELEEDAPCAQKHHDVNENVFNPRLPRSRDEP